MFAASNFLILFVALIADRLIGDPDWLWRRVSHPVVLFGRLVEWCDKRFNRPDCTDTEREKAGYVAIVTLLVPAIVAGRLATLVFTFIGPVGGIIEIVVVTVFLAQKSLTDHVEAVVEGLRFGGLAGGRAAVAKIVGRDPATLDEAGVSRAAIESLAENTSDGVVAPAFWYAALGLPGLFAYKMLNTADSMIGHHNDTYRDFGRASARLDDFANWLPARLTGLLFVAAVSTLRGAERAQDSFAIMRRDAGLHRSPNAGWPESAMAGGLGISLGGPRVYAGDMTNEPFMNAEGYRDASDRDIGVALKVFWRSMTIFATGIVVLAMTTTFIAIL